jgi:hypothetical protein
VGQQQQQPTGGVWLFEQPKHGTGKVFISFGNFSSNAARGGALAWDACGGPPTSFDNGHPIEIVGVGSAIGSMRVHSNSSRVGVLAGSGCAVRYPSAAADLKLLGPYRSSAKAATALPSDYNYLEVAGSGISTNNDTGVRRVGVTQVSAPFPAWNRSMLTEIYLCHACSDHESKDENGVTQDARGCRGACEVEPSCTSYTWRSSTSTAAGQSHQRPSGDWSDLGTGEGECFLRTDNLWLPNGTTMSPWARAENASVVSGRPWHFDGDNPAPLIDPESGEVKVMYRTDVNAGSLWTKDGKPNTYHTASLIGMATAPSWRGPYAMAGVFGGSISNQQYPFDENEVRSVPEHRVKPSLSLCVSLSVSLSLCLSVSLSLCLSVSLSVCVRRGGGGAFAQMRKFGMTELLLRRGSLPGSLPV